MKRLPLSGCDRPPLSFHITSQKPVTFQTWLTSTLNLEVICCCETAIGSKVGQEICFYSTASRPVLGSTQPPIQRVLGAPSPRIKWQGREADHSPPSNTEVKMVELYLHSPLHLHGVVIN
jgi:hypothetical protein